MTDCRPFYLMPLFHKLCVLELCERNAARPGGISFTLYIHMFFTLGGGGQEREHANFKRSEPL